VKSSDYFTVKELDGLQRQFRETKKINRVDLKSVFRMARRYAQLREDHRKIVFCSPLLSGLLCAYDYSRNIDSREIEIKSLQLNNTEYARFNDLVRFGLLTRPDGMKSGCYMVPRKRVQQFFRGKLTVSRELLVHPTTKEIIYSPEQIHVWDVPNVETVREEYGDKFTQYIKEENLKHAFN